MARRASGNPNLSLDAIVASAIEYVDERGLDALTMRALANTMGVYPTALYWYVGSKSRLVSLAAAQLLGNLFIEREVDKTWQAWLIDTGRAMRVAMHRHPNFATVLGSQIAVDMTTATPFIEAVLGVLREAGFHEDDIVPAYNAYTGTVIGWVSVELSAEPQATGRDEHWQVTFREQLESLSSIRFPNVSRSMPKLANQAFMTRWESGKSNPMDASYDFLLAALVAGFERSSARRYAI